jgi:lipopolysaccharide/colanic/teichoic acid biosynthesis glycosyltransferase
MPSVTRLGQTLRHSGINKLPLLLNLLRGEISIVGSHLFMAAPGKAFSPLDLHEVRPGIISWAHVNDDHGESADAALRRSSYGTDSESENVRGGLRLNLEKRKGKSTYWNCGSRAA